MRVHFLNENLGGHATMHRHLRDALRAHPEIEPSWHDLPEPGLVHRVARAPVPGLARLDLDLSPFRDQLLRARGAARHLEGLRDVDVLHAYTHNAVLLAGATLDRIPTVVSLDSTNRQNALRHPTRPPTRFTALSARPAAALERGVYQRARAVVTHSRWAADGVLEYGVPAEKLHVVPFGIPVGDPPPDRPLRERPRIVFIGATMARKGGWRLIDLWRTHLADRADLVLVTREAVPPEPGLVVYGDVRPGDGKLDVILEGVDLFAMPGDVDAFGYALLEAMAAGLPVVAPDLAAAPELVGDEAGLLVPATDDAALVAALGRLIDDHEQRRRLGRAGYERVLDRFSADRTTDELVAILRSVGS